VLVVGVGTDVTINSATYNSVSMTAVAAQQGTVRMFYLIAPATGSNQVSISMSANGFNTGGAVSVTGADQTTPVDVENGAAGQSVSLTTTVDDCFLVDVGYFDGEGSAPSVGASQTERWSVSIESHPGFGSSEVAGTAGSYTMSWSGGDQDDIQAVAIAPVGGDVMIPTFAARRGQQYRRKRI